MTLQKYILNRDYAFVFIGFLSIAMSGFFIYMTTTIYKGVNDTAIKIILAFGGLFGATASVIAGMMILLWVGLKVIR